MLLILINVCRALILNVAQKHLGSSSWGWGKSVSTFSPKPPQVWTRSWYINIYISIFFTERQRWPCLPAPVCPPVGKMGIFTTSSWCLPNTVYCSIQYIYTQRGILYFSSILYHMYVTAAGEASLRENCLLIRPIHVGLTIIYIKHIWNLSFIRCICCRPKVSKRWMKWW